MRRETLETVVGTPTVEDLELDPLREGFHDGLGWRHVVVGLAFVIICVCYADRTNIGIVLAENDLAGIPHSEKGSILSAFFVGYITSQLPGAFVARRCGAKSALLLAAITWTTFDVLTPVLATVGVAPLLMARMGMGIGEGFVFPTQHAIASFWVPREERAFLVSFMTSGQDFGCVLANLVSPALMRAGVAWVFGFWALVALVWACLFSKFSASAPELHDACLRLGEAAWIQEGRDAPHIHEVRYAQSEEPVCPLFLLREPCVWGIILGHVGANYAAYVALLWIPSFFAEAHNLDITTKPHLLAAPYMAGFMGLVAAGRISDWMISRGARTRHVRKLCHVTGALVQAACLQCAASAHSASSASVWIALAQVGQRVQTAGFWVNMVDVCPEAAATLMALSNTFGTLPGIIGQPTTQLILEDTSSWSRVFGVACAASLLGAIAFAALADDAPLAMPGARVAQQADDVWEPECTSSTVPTRVLGKPSGI